VIEYAVFLHGLA